MDTLYFKDHKDYFQHNVTHHLDKKIKLTINKTIF